MKARLDGRPIVVPAPAYFKAKRVQPENGRNIKKEDCERRKIVPVSGLCKNDDAPDNDPQSGKDRKIAERPWQAVALAHRPRAPKPDSRR